MHLYLRVTDVLFEHLLKYLEVLDKSNNFDLSQRKYLKILVEFCEKECKVTSPFYLSKKGIVKLRSLNQNDRLRILNGFQLKNLIQLYENVPNIQNNDTVLSLNFVFLEFNRLFSELKKDNSLNFDKELLTGKLKIWLKFYLKATQNKELTPYVHSLVFHVPEFIEKFHHLNLYTTQSLEQLNSVTKTHYFRQTNRRLKDLAFIKQLLEKQNRMEFIYLKGTMLELYEKINRNNSIV